MLLWLENGGPPITLAAATAHLFSPTLIKPMKYQYVFLENHNFAYKTNEISTFSQNQSTNQRENHVFEKGLSHLLSICQIQNVT